MFGGSWTWLLRFGLSDSDLCVLFGFFQSYSVKDTVRDILASQDYGFDVTRPKSSHAVLHPEPGRSRIIQVEKPYL